MDALTRKVITCGAYAEHWHGGRLYIEYSHVHSFDVRFDGQVWEPVDFVHETTRSYLVSAAVFADALDKCTRYGFAPTVIHEFLPREKSELIPAELFRLLMDDAGLGIDDALDTVVRSFGDALCRRVERGWLLDIQPRVAFLENVLYDELSQRAVAFHDAYLPQYRCPTGAIEENDRIILSLAVFGGVHSAELTVSGDDFTECYPMQYADGRFYVSFSHPRPEALFYSFRINGEYTLFPSGDGHSSQKAPNGDGFRLTVYKRGFKTPERFRRSIMYQIFPDRFGFSDTDTARRGIEYHRSLGQSPQLHGSIAEPVKWQPLEGQADYAPDDFYGGTLNGIADKLPYLKQLGIGTVYLNPIVEARSNHRYDCSNYEKVDPVLGAAEDYVNLCHRAEGLGIAIINDGVFSHTGADSIYFDRYGNYGGLGAYQSKASPYYSWFDFRSYPQDYRCWWGFKDLPEVNERNADWQEHMVSGENSIVRLWLRRGASGWRLDVADELPDDVLELIRSAAKEEKPDSVIIGEVWEDAVLKISYGSRRRYALGTALDSVMNYPFRSAVIAFARGKISAFELRDVLRQQQFNYPRPLYMALMNLLSSHDVERLHTSLGAETDSVKQLTRRQQAEFALTPEQSLRATALQKLCAAIQYCTPGVPCLYYGDEECLDGAGDPFDRAPFEPSGKGLHNFYVRLGEVRNSSPALLDGEAEFSAVSPDVFIISRTAESERVVCVINRAAAPFTLPFEGGDPLLESSENGVIPPVSAEIFKFT